MRKVGLHIRLTDTLSAVAQKAYDLQLPIFQCFLIQQNTNKFLCLSDQEIKNFLDTWRSKFDNIYVHGSYWINLANPQSHNKIILREIELAKKLEFTHIIVHPGALQNGEKKDEGISIIANNLNNLLKQEQNITVILENSAHAGSSIGGDLHDFWLLRQRLEYPEKIVFCIDTAHAHAYGYDIASEQGKNHFMNILQKTIGFSNIILIHLNDIKMARGSRIDKHEKIGTGLLGNHLKQFIQHESFKNKPIILEAPVIDENEERELIELVKGW